MLIAVLLLRLWKTSYSWFYIILLKCTNRNAFFPGVSPLDIAYEGSPLPVYAVSKLINNIANQFLLLFSCVI